MKLSDIYRKAEHKSAIQSKLSHYFDVFGTTGEGKGESNGSEEVHAQSPEMTQQFYDLVTDFYEFGWGHSFHFAPRHNRESFDASIARHEHFLALKLGLQPGMEVADLGAGVGGPMREIARFSGASVTGINISKYQIEKGNGYVREAGLENLCRYLEGSFMDIPAEDESFDAVYAVEATCHAASRRGVFGEAFRVLKPGGCFAAYEWVMTPKYDENNAEHRAIKRGIEEGNSLPPMPPGEGIDEAMKDVGFEMLESFDMDANPHFGSRRWHEPLKGGGMNMQTFRQSAIGRRFTDTGLTVLEKVGAAPVGSLAVSQFLNRAADALVAGGDTQIFTPLYFFIGRKPLPKRTRRRRSPAKKKAEKSE